MPCLLGGVHRRPDCRCRSFLRSDADCALVCDGRHWQSFSARSLSRPGRLVPPDQSPVGSPDRSLGRLTVGSTCHGAKTRNAAIPFLLCCAPLCPCADALRFLPMRIAILSSGLGWHVRDLLRATSALGHTAEAVDFRRVCARLPGRASSLAGYDAMIVRTMPP